MISFPLKQSFYGYTVYPIFRHIQLHFMQGAHRVDCEELPGARLSLEIGGLFFLGKA